MNILKTILASGNGQLVDQLAKQFDLNQDQASGAVGALLPSLTRALAKNTAQSGGLDSLISALQRGNHGKYVDDLSSLNNQETVDDGNNILGHIFGSKDVSRNVAAHAAEQTNVDYGTLKKMLPVIAAAAMGMMSKKVGSDSAQAGENSGMGAMLSSFLDADNDGSVVDDVLGMAKRLF